MSQEVAPIVVLLGRTSKKKLRALEAGGGPLADDVAEVMARVRDELGPEAVGKELVPVVVVYKRKRPRGKKHAGLLDLLL